MVLDMLPALFEDVSITTTVTIFLQTARDFFILLTLVILYAGSRNYGSGKKPGALSPVPEPFEKENFDEFMKNSDLPRTPSGRCPS